MVGQVRAAFRWVRLNGLSARCEGGHENLELFGRLLRPVRVNDSNMVFGRSSI
jgi:hypothetical protein